MTRENLYDEATDEAADFESADPVEYESDPSSATLPLPPASGLYISTSPLLPIKVKDEMRLDVDGRYPQMTASGTLRSGIANRVHWIAKLTSTGSSSWKGNIWFKDGHALTFTYTTVSIKVQRSFITSQQKATVVFSGGGAAKLTRNYKYKSRYFRSVDFEFDFVEGEAALTQINTGAHPNRPATLPIENLSIQKVFNRAGFNVTTSAASGSLPLAGAGVDAVWSDNEMHDAMQTFWSRFAATAQWAFWVFFASLHESGTSLGGVMFDDIGPNQRQGTAIFNDAFISVPPAGDANPAAWVQRMIFWTAAHEMGHSFNLAHSWQKSLVFGGHGPWIPLADEPEVRSFMNYPFRVAGGQSSFFSDFEYRFSDGELLFMRHAPERFVRMGDALWFDHHGFREADVSPEPSLKLEVRVNRARPLFEFLEPVVLELKLTNISSQPQIVPDNILAMQEAMTVIIKRQGQTARQYAPYARYCYQPGSKVLAAGESLYESLFAAAGLNGWQISEPGNYLIQVALHLGGEDIVSNPLTLRVSPPRGYEEEELAQDFFSDDVGRVLAFDGTRYLEKSNDVLRQVADQLSDRRVSIHARVPLGKAKAQDYKLLDVERYSKAMTAALAGGKITTVASSRPDDAYKELAVALTDRPAAAAETLGHIDYKYYVDFFTDCLAEDGESESASSLQDTLHDTLSSRGVLESVLQKIRARRDGTARAAGR